MKVFFLTLVMTLSLFLTSFCFAQEFLASNTLASGVNKNHAHVYTDLAFKGGYHWAEDLKSSLSLGIVKEFTGEAKLLFKDMVLETYRSNLYIHPQTEIAAHGFMRIFLPTSKSSQDKSEIMAFKTGTALSKNYLKWNFGYELSGSYFLHRFITAKDEASNLNYGITNTLTLGYALSEILYLNTALSLLNFATYNTTPKATYSFIQEIDYILLLKVEASFGLSTGGRQYRNNGKELNLALFDAEGSELFLGVNYVF